MAARSNSPQCMEAIRHIQTFVWGVAIHEVKQHHKTPINQCVRFPKLDRTAVAAKVIIRRPDHLFAPQSF